MLVADAVLPAAAHLTGPRADRVLAAALDAVGGRLEKARAAQLQYRPGHDVVVRFESRVCWSGRGVVDETLLAAATAGGPPVGTLPVEAIAPDGTTVSVGVWRWPFDPVVTGLTDAVTASTATDLLAGLASGRVRLEVLAYRPTQRAVVRAVDDSGRVFYIKALPPAAVDELVDRHRRLLDSGVPVPTILRSDPARGLIVMRELAGPTIRERIKADHAHFPPAEEYEAVYNALTGVVLPEARPVDGRAATALRHAQMLATVLPVERHRLRRLSDILGPAAERAARRSGPTIHGDLYEAQLITGRGSRRTHRIVGVLDLDDAGPGDPLDDRATVIAHLIDRAIDGRGDSRRVVAYARSLRRSFAAQVDPVELDLVIAGALVGLATGPFRMQQARWGRAVRRRLSLASRLAAQPGEKALRITS